MSSWEIVFHPDFLKDLNKLGQKELKIFSKKKNKIKKNPLRLKHLSGGESCYREEITTNVRLIYLIEESKIYFLIIDKHDDAYNKFRKRLYSLKQRLDES